MRKIVINNRLQDYNSDSHLVGPLSPKIHLKATTSLYRYLEALLYQMGARVYLMLLN